MSCCSDTQALRHDWWMYVSVVYRSCLLHSICSWYLLCEYDVECSRCLTTAQKKLIYWGKFPPWQLVIGSLSVLQGRYIARAIHLWNFCWVVMHLLRRNDLPAWLWCFCCTDMTFLLDSVASILLTWPSCVTPLPVVYWHGRPSGFCC